MSYDQMRALRHYTEQARLAEAQARFDNLAEPEGDEFAEMHTKLDIAMQALKHARAALCAGDEVKASGYVDDAVIELRGVL